jgi:flagellar secretion chaperone FliS
MNPYQTRAYEGASGVELTVALYDGIIRFLYQAIDAVERGEVSGRRAAVKRAMDILVHLQATLQMDIGGEPAKALAEFYAAMFAIMLQGSQSNSSAKFQHAIDCVRNVRDAWRQVAKDQATDSLPDQFKTIPAPHLQQGGNDFDSEAAVISGSNWSA